VSTVKTSLQICDGNENIDHHNISVLAKLMVAIIVIFIFTVLW